MRPWILPLLWTIWRCGIPEMKNDALEKFCEPLGFKIEGAVTALVEEGLVELFQKRFEFRKPELLTFIRLTPKGLELVLADEGARWKDALAKRVYPKPDGVPLEMFLLREQGKTLEEVGKTFGKSREQVRTLVERHVRRTKWYKERSQKVDDFLGGELAFKDLPIEVLGDMSVRLANALYRAEMHTVPDVLTSPVQRYLRMFNFGRKTLKELNGLLALCGTKILECHYWDLKYLKDAL